MGDDTAPLDTLPTDGGGSSFYLTPQGGGVVCDPSSPSSCQPGVNLMTGAPLATNPITGQPSSTVSSTENWLSNNSTLIVAVCAIGGLLVALLQGKHR